jgi:hypothetical protein
MDCIGGTHTEQEAGGGEQHAQGRPPRPIAHP